MRARVCVGARAQAWTWACNVIQHATRRHIAICGLSGFTRFLDIFSQTTQFSEKSVYFTLIYNFYLKDFFIIIRV
jgi:hypothetical protein